MKIGDYVDPLVFAPGATSGYRKVLRVTSVVGGLFLGRAADGERHFFTATDDPRPADDEQISDYRRGAAVTVREMSQ